MWNAVVTRNVFRTSAHGLTTEGGGSSATLRNSDMKPLLSSKKFRFPIPPFHQTSAFSKSVFWNRSWSSLRKYLMWLFGKHRSSTASISETKSHREHRLKTCILLRKKVGQDAQVLYLLGMETARSLPKPV